MNIWKIIRFVLVVGCIIGAYAYMDSVSKQRETARSIQKMRSEEAVRHTREYYEQEKRNKEQEEKKENEFQENANNAEYQVNYWHNKYGELKEKSYLESRMSRVQIAELERERKKAKEELVYWIEKRAEELSSKRDEAEEADNIYERDRYNDKLEELTKKAEIIDDDDWNEDE